jgi:hypothetical protein
MPAELLHMSIDVEVGSEPPRGEVHCAGGPTRRFDSWLDLVTALDRLIEASKSRAGDSPPDPR